MFVLCLPRVEHLLSPVAASCHHRMMLTADDLGLESVPLGASQTFPLNLGSPSVQ